MQQSLPKLVRAQIRLVAVSVESRADGQALRKRLGIGFPLLSNPSATAIKRYGVYDAGNGISWPALVLIDRSGRVRWRHISAQYTQRLTTEQVLRRIGALR